MTSDFKCKSLLNRSKLLIIVFIAFLTIAYFMLYITMSRAGMSRAHAQQSPGFYLVPVIDSDSYKQHRRLHLFFYPLYKMDRLLIDSMPVGKEPLTELD